MPRLTCWPFLFATIWHISSAKMKKRKSQTQWDRELAHLLPARLPNHYYTKAAFTLLHNPPFLNLLSPPLSLLQEEVIPQPDYGCVFFFQSNANQIWTIRGTIQGRDAKEAFGPTSSSWQGKRSSRPPCQVKARVARSLPWRTRTNEHARSGGNGWQSKCCRQTWTSDGAKIAAVWPSESARSRIDPPSIGLVITMNSLLC